MTFQPFQCLPVHIFVEGAFTIELRGVGCNVYMVAPSCMSCILIKRNKHIPIYIKKQNIH